MLFLGCDVVGCLCLVVWLVLSLLVVFGWVAGFVGVCCVACRLWCLGGVALLLGFDFVGLG